MNKNFKIKLTENALLIDGKEFFLTSNDEIDVETRFILDANLSDLPQGISVRLCEKLIGGEDLFGRSPGCTFKRESADVFLCHLETVFIMSNTDGFVETVQECDFRHLLNRDYSVLEPLKKRGLVYEGPTETIYSEIAHLSLTIKLVDQSIRDAVSYMEELEMRLQDADNPGFLFLCHASEDKKLVDRLAKELNKRGLSVWYDKYKIFVGDSIVREINMGLRNTRLLIAVLSTHSVKKEWEQKEMDSTLMRQLSGEEIKILPILIEPCDIPPLLSDIKYADFTTSFKDGFEELVNSIRWRV